MDKEDIIPVSPKYYRKMKEKDECIQHLEKENDELKKYIESANKTHLNMSGENLRLKKENEELKKRVPVQFTETESFEVLKVSNLQLQAKIEELEQELDKANIRIKELAKELVTYNGGCLGNNCPICKNTLVTNGECKCNIHLLRAHLRKSLKEIDEIRIENKELRSKQLQELNEDILWSLVGKAQDIVLYKRRESDSPADIAMNTRDLVDEYKKLFGTQKLPSEDKDE